MPNFINDLKENTFLPKDFIGITGLGTPSIHPPADISASNSLNEILCYARRQNASDVHLSSSSPVIFRISNQLLNITRDSLSDEQVRKLVTDALPAEIIQSFEKTGDIEHVYTLQGYGRFRMTLIKQRNGWDLTARLIPMSIPKIEDTGMPPACANLTKWAQGMILVTGPAGCGKTTTLSILVDMVNCVRHEHIVTIEQPIEIVYQPKQCQITQREINLHTLSQENALRAALREDPDILVVSELRDLKTIQLAISAAETGHLVLGTMNTTSAAQTISRIVDSFPTDEQPIIKNMISESLRGIICQQLIPKKDGNGVIVAYEILIVTPSVSNLIREGKVNQINNVIATGKASGMILMDTSLEALYANGSISKEEACQRATNPASMLLTLDKVICPK